MLKKFRAKKHLKPINYDRWAELYWKRQLEENLRVEEEKELKKGNVRTIEKAYNQKEDAEIQIYIEKKSHEMDKGD